MKSCIFTMVLLLLLSTSISAGEILRDNFDRSGPLHSGQTSDGKFSWSVFPASSQDKFQVAHGRMNFNATSGVMYVSHKEMRQRDFRLAFDFTYLSHHYARSLSVNYRLQSNSGKSRLSDGGHAGGYVLHIDRPSRSLLRFRLLKESAGKTKPETLISSADVVTANRWDITTRIHLHVSGAHHQVFINDDQTPTIDVTDDEFIKPGWWNIADGALTKRAIDNLTFSSVDSSASLHTTRPGQNHDNNDKIDLIKPLFPIHYTGKVTPTPQQVLSEWQNIPVSKADLQVQTASDTHNAVALARSLLVQRLEELSNAPRDRESGSTKNKLLVYLGDLDSAFIQEISRELDLDLKEIVLQPRGYVIRRMGNRILAAGVDHRGTFYAAVTLYQSMGIRDGEMILRIADINDWPDWNWYQSVYAIPDKRGLLWMAMYKIPGISLQQRDEWRNIHPSGKPQHPGKWANWEQVLREHQEFNDKFELLDRQLVINIYAARPRLLPMLDITNDKHIEELTDTCRFAAEMGISHIMIAADDWTPERDGEYILPYPNERAHFRNSAGRAHGTLMRRLYRVLKPDFPDLELSFVPPPYSIYRHGIPVNNSHQRYLRDLAAELPHDISLLWTGPRIRSPSITRDDYLRWMGYVDNQNSYLWDNSAGPEPIKRWQTVFYEGFEADSGGKLFVNGDIFGRAYNLAFAINTADYLWNPQGYQAGESYGDAVEKMYGDDTAETAEKFVSAYAQLRIFKKNPAKIIKLLDELDSLAISMKQQGWPMQKPIFKLEKLREEYQPKNNQAVDQSE